jgi:hypothetical protein
MTGMEPLAAPLFGTLDGWATQGSDDDRRESCRFPESCNRVNTCVKTGRNFRTGRDIAVGGQGACLPSGGSIRLQFRVPGAGMGATPSLPHPDVV